jgi:two-component system OmpR family sensor kinase
MSDTHSSARRWPGPPLVLQILGLLLAGLVIAQVVTLFLTLILPPAPSPEHSLAEVAAVLQGAPSGENRPDPLQRVVQSGPPDLTGAGWLVSARSEQELAQRLGVDPADVRLAFYTPLPFAGTSPNRTLGLKANDGPIPGLEQQAGVQKASLLILAQATVPRAPGFPRDAFPARGTFPAGTFPPGTFPDGARGGPRNGINRGSNPFIDGEIAAHHRGEPLIRLDPTEAKAGDGGIWIGGDHGETIPEILRSRGQTPGTTTQSAGGTTITVTPPSSRTTTPTGQTPQLPMFNRDPGGEQRRFGEFGPQMLTPMPVPVLPDRSFLTPSPRMTITPSAPMATPGGIDTNRPAPAPYGQRAPLSTVPIQPAPMITPAPMLIQNDIHRPAPQMNSSDPLVPLPERAGGLFGFAPAPFVEGDFVAALKVGNGKWAIVQPAPESFPNAWQRRVLLWFLIAFAVVAPVGWLFARRIVKPLAGFAEAAETLGRDPSAQILDLDGPAEIGRAARAFNVMQSRLKSFVDDRTAMIGAISHDLRTPLTRLRFRIEDVDDDHIREGMIEEVEQMEQMITSVLGFIREASSPGVRERLDLRMILDDVVEDATMIGGDVSMESAAPAPVEVDVLGMRRLFTNLVDNAVKYGERARVRLSVANGEAIAEVTDDGPGVPDDDLERAFEPFYRTANALSSDKRGSGLGLAVCRSIARAHGGDVRLLRSSTGFTAQLRVPLAFDTDRVAA